MKSLTVLLLIFLVGATLDAGELDTSYALPKSLSDWVCQSSTVEKSGRKIVSYAIYHPDRSHVITLAFVNGYRDKEITQDHFDALVKSFAREGLTEVKERKPVTRYGMAGAQVIARGVVQESVLQGKGIILKNGESELTILMFAIGVDLESVEFDVALSGLGIAAK